MNARKIGVGALVAIMFFSIAGAVASCDPTTEGEAKPTASAVAEPAAAAQTTTQAPPTTTKPAAGAPKTVPTTPIITEDVRDAAFVMVTEQLAPGASAGERIDFGHTICDTLDSGVSMEAVALTLLENGTPENAGGWLGASTTAYCPQHSAAVENLGN